MAVSTITGLGSGLNINDLVKALADAEKAPKQTQINIQKARHDTQLSAVGMLKSAVETFESSLLSLKSSSTAFEGYKASSSKSDVASVTMGAGAVAGSYKLEVTQLATASKVASSAQTSSTYAQGGKLTISVGSNTHALNIADGASLTDIRNAINEQLGSAGISANIITDGQGGSRLVLASETTGAGTDISVEGEGDLAALNITGTDALDGSDANSAGYIAQAADAVFKLDGLEMSSKTNTVTNLSGLTIKLEGEGTTNLSVSANTDGIVGSVESFVMAYNTLLTVTNGLTKVTQTTDKDGNATTQAGALVADSTLRSMMTQLRRALSNPSEGTGNLKSLADLGISTNRDGSLALDSDKLKKVVTQDPAALAQKQIVAIEPSAIQAFFTGEDGLINRIGDITSVYSGAGGLLATREKSLNDAKESLAADQIKLDLRIESLTTSLFKKFNAMDTLVARLNATSQSVLATLNALNNKKDD